MAFAFEKLNGLNRELVLATVEPVVTAHGLAGVELIWRTDQRGWVLYVTLERPGSDAGAGITLDDCTEVSRDLSAALDAGDVIPGAYRLDVGTPGLERKLYQIEDYQRFAGSRAKVKLHEPLDGQWTLVGTLQGVDDQGSILLATETVHTEGGVLNLQFAQIQSGQLVLDLAAHGIGGGNKQRPQPRQSPRQARGPKSTVDKTSRRGNSARRRAAKSG